MLAVHCLWTVDGLLVGRGAGNGCFRPKADMLALPEHLS